MKTTKNIASIAVVSILAFLTISIVIGNNRFGDTEGDAVSAAGVTERLYFSPGASPPSSVQVGGTTDNGVTYGGIAWGGLQVGYVGKNKIIRDSSEVYIPRLSNDRYGLVETNVTVKRLNESGKVVQTLQGKALVFANKSDTANAGYVMVEQSQARTWVSVLNGNPDFVFNSSKSNIYPYSIEDVDTGKKFTAYNLADLAIVSGGAGDPPPGDGLTKIRDNLYLKRDGFIATPRPVGDITVGPALPATRSLAAAPIAAPPNATPKSLVAASSSDVIPSSIKPRYVDESGNHFADAEKVLLVFGKFDGLDEDKRFPMVFTKIDNKIFGVKQLDKATGTITVGKQIGEITRTEGKHIFFHLEVFPELEGKELSIEVQQ